MKRPDSIGIDNFYMSYKKGSFNIIIYKFTDSTRWYVIPM